MNDAMEGLEQVKDPINIELLVEQINRDLRKKIDKKIKLKQRRRLKQYSWIYFAAFLLLLLVMIAWFVIYRVQHQPHLIHP
jgi:bacteriorhodopsin